MLIDLLVEVTLLTAQVLFACIKNVNCGWHDEALQRMVEHLQRIVKTEQWEVFQVYCRSLKELLPTTEELLSGICSEAIQHDLRKIQVEKGCVVTYHR